ncbi:MAG TPA: hypothetical protein PLW35_12550, partial [Verrucomicrobiota bacterium]|nr:hypothetical protein [Verrucomicrobiota bacterium]
RQHTSATQGDKFKSGLDRDTNKCLDVITTAGPHELTRAEGPIYTSLGQRPRYMGQISDNKG